MTILADFPAESVPCDICIVGTGPAGLALALECERLGLKVLALEAGGKNPGSIPRSEVEILSPNHHAPLHITTRSAFGGTSWGWSGLCTRFDDIDFAVRPHITDSGWPIRHSELAPYYQRAASLLNCRIDDASPVDESWHTLEGVTLDNRAYTSAQPRLGESHWEYVARSKAITVCLNTAVVGLDLGTDGRKVEAIAVNSRGRAITLHPPRVALAGGGLRTTQLLLATQRHWPDHFGGADGILGRNYMGHLTGWISSIRFNNRADAIYFKPFAVEGAKSAQRRSAFIISCSGPVLALSMIQRTPMAFSRLLIWHWQFPGSARCSCRDHSAAPHLARSRGTTCPMSRMLGARRCKPRWMQCAL